MPDFWVAIPDSALSDEQTKRDKSIKIAQFARACSIFRVKRIYIYHDSLSQFEREDPNLLKTILQYLDTPQYLRKILYPRMHQLEYAGILHPIKAPHHRPPEDIKKVRAGDVRTGVIAKVKGQLFVEAGLGSLIPFVGAGFEGKKVNVKF
ncbi:MAG TPA: putative RNA uridine N3 methyltransferase, partial [Nitrososphaera sp.]|nr:putative RNA uridine N3 methyltransferase [Nitrososphaera sp.]